MDHGGSHEEDKGDPFPCMENSKFLHGKVLIFELPRVPRQLLNKVFHLFSNVLGITQVHKNIVFPPKTQFSTQLGVRPIPIYQDKGGRSGGG